MPRLRTAPGLLTVWICSLGAFASPAVADPLRFDNVRATTTGAILVPLFENTGHVFTLEENRNLSFFIDLVGTVVPGQTDVLRLTYRASDGETLVQEYGVPVFGTTLPPLTLVTGREFPATYTPRLYQLTIDLLNTSPDFVIPAGANAGAGVDSFAYSFNTVSPVPEPGTWLLLGSGLTMLLRRRRAR